LLCDRSPISIIGADGRFWDLHEGDLAAAVRQTIFRPAVQGLATQNNPIADGGRVTPTGWAPSIVPVRLLAMGDDGYSIRAKLDDFGNSLTAGAGLCTIIAYNAKTGTERQILGRFEDGLEYALENHRETEAIETDLVFQCPSPLWEATEVERVPFAAGVDNALTVTLSLSSLVHGYLPIAGDGTLEQQPGIRRRVITYGGTVAAWPVFEISGPFTSIEIGCNGRVIAYTTPILAGDVLRIETAPYRATLNGVPASGNLRTDLGDGPFQFHPGANYLAYDVVDGDNTETKITAEATPLYGGPG